MKFSLITAVYGVNKLHFIESLIKSLIKQSCHDFELIIVDQNKTDEVKTLLSKYLDLINIVYLKTDIPGLSKARNIGLDNAKGEFVSFPDDDCEYPDGLLQNISNFFEKNKIYDALITSLKDTDKHHKLPYSSITESKELVRSDVFKVANSNSIFHRNNFSIRFDVDFGIGEKYKSCEEFDYVLNIMLSSGRVFYEDSLFVYHPDFLQLSKEERYKKIEVNSVGHGAYFKKHLRILFHSMMYYVFLTPILGYIISIIKADKNKENIYKMSMKGRLKGFFLYKS